MRNSDEVARGIGTGGAGVEAVVVDAQSSTGLRYYEPRRCGRSAKLGRTQGSRVRPRLSDGK